MEEQVEEMEEVEEDMEEEVEVEKDVEEEVEVEDEALCRGLICSQGSALA